MIKGDESPVAVAIGATTAASLDVFCFLFATCASSFASTPPLVPTPTPIPVLVSLRLAFFLMSTVTAGVDALLLPPAVLLLFAMAC